MHSCDRRVQRSPTSAWQSFPPTSITRVFQCRFRILSTLFTLTMLRSIAFVDNDPYCISYAYLSISNCTVFFFLGFLSYRQRLDYITVILSLELAALRARWCSRTIPPPSITRCTTFSIFHSV